MQALEEGRRRAHAELKTSERYNADKEQNLEVRSHVLTLREGELDSRLRDRERTIDDLNLRLRELTVLLRKEQATRKALTRQLAEMRNVPAPKPARSLQTTKSKVKRRAMRKKTAPTKKYKRSRRR